MLGIGFLLSLNVSAFLSSLLLYRAVPVNAYYEERIKASGIQFQSLLLSTDFPLIDCVLHEQPL